MKAVYFYKKVPGCFVAVAISNFTMINNRSMVLQVFSVLLPAAFEKLDGVCPRKRMFQTFIGDKLERREKQERNGNLNSALFCIKM